MSTEDQESNNTEESSDDSAPKPMSPAKRKRLQKCFEHASKLAAGGNSVYANELFTQCVAGDPGNLVYIHNFLNNLQNQYNNNKKGGTLAGIKSAGSKAKAKKAIHKKDWDTAVKSILEVLRLNPWDTSGLTSMSSICEGLGHDEPELFYLKQAYEINSKDPEISRLCARALGRQGQYEQAIIFWHHVEVALPKDEEAKYAVGRLVVQRSIDRAKEERPDSVAGLIYEDPNKKETVEVKTETLKVSQKKKLQEEIENNPENPKPYMELADMFSAQSDFKNADASLKKGLAATDGNIKIREHREEIQIRYQREQIEAVKKNLEKEKTDEEKTKANQKRFKKLKKDLLRLEIKIYRDRRERYPTNVTYGFELALRYKTAKMFKEAIELFQELRKDPKRKASGSLELGQCFQHIKQFSLALAAYDDTIKVASVREIEYKKEAMYLAGRLCKGIKEIDKSFRYISELAALDFAYKDVSEILDKVNRMRDII